jgi:acyl carrier protein
MVALREDDARIHLFAGVRSFCCHTRPSKQPFWSHVRNWEYTPNGIRSDLLLFDGTGELFAEAVGVSFLPMPGVDGPQTDDRASEQRATSPSVAPAPCTPPPLQRGAPDTDLARQLLAAVSQDAQQLLEAKLATWTKHILGIPEDTVVDPKLPLLSLGFDSLTSIDMVDRIRDELGVILDNAFIFENPTSEALARDILERLRMATTPAVPG